MHLFNKKHFSDLAVSIHKVSEMDVRNAVRDYLKYAPDRRGGNRRRGGGGGGYNDGNGGDDRVGLDQD